MSSTKAALQAAEWIEAALDYTGCASWSPSLTEQGAALLARLRDALSAAEGTPERPAAPAEQLDEEALYLIYYADTGVNPQLVQGRLAAEAVFERVSQNWNAHLFGKIKSNTRDDRHSANNIAPTQAKAAAPSGARDIIEMLAYLLEWSIKNNGGDTSGCDEEWLADAKAWLVDNPEQAAEPSELVNGMSDLAHTNNAPLGFTTNEASAWSVGHESGAQAWMPFALTLDAALNRGDDPKLLMDENSPLRGELRRLIDEVRRRQGT